MPKKRKMRHKKPFNSLAHVEDTIEVDIFKSLPRVKKKHVAEWRTLKTLVAATSDICRARYHYFCHEDEADFACVQQEYFVVAANCEKLDVLDQNDQTKVLTIQQSAARLVKKQAQSQFYHNGGIFFDFVKEKIKGWQEKYRVSLSGLGSFQTQKNLKFDVVMFPEFGLPVQPKDETAKPFLVKIVEECLSTVHRPFFFTGSAHQESPILNIGFASPPNLVEGTGYQTALTSVEVFDRKAGVVTQAAHHELNGVTLTQASNDRLQVQIKKTSIVEYSSEEFDRTWRNSSDASIKLIGSAAKNLVNNAYKFYDSIKNAASQRKISQDKYPNGFLPITKKAPALKLQEALEPQGMIDLDVFVTKLGVFAVLICYDAYDPRMFLTLLRLYQGSLKKRTDFEHPAPDVILVPAYNRSKKLKLMCRNLSFATNSIVVYASNHEDHAGNPAVYVCGREWKDWEEPLTGGKDVKIPDFFTRDTISGFEILKLHRPTLNNVMSLAANRDSVSTTHIKDRGVTANLFG